MALRHLARRACSGAAAAQPAERLFVGMVVERLPRVLPAVPAWEAEYDSWAAELRQGRLRELPDALAAPRKAEDDEGAEGGAGVGDAWAPAPVATAADEAKDVRSTRRALADFLFLVVKDKRTGRWGFPTAPHEEGETARATAERALAASLADGAVETYTVGNAPCGHIAEAEGTGAPLFFYRASFLDGEVRLASGGAAKDFAWLTKAELKEYLDEPQAELCQTML